MSIQNENKSTAAATEVEKDRGDHMDSRRFHLIGIIVSSVCVILSVIALILSLQ
ncbi:MULTISPECIES: hypothetical protein [Bacillus subtilis group]|nr:MULTISPECIES: hypothetical protein [Bacillus subtilis group]MEC5225273.1 hypothetical protein [Bacillus licheniformis]MED4337812.1 hypothetical protein [Bacillus licheniformis]WOH90908.1 hypothetical protein RZN08_20545 [Bacillus paralicheniformis]